MTVSYLPRTTQETKTFIAIDGEGKNTPDGRHIYTFLAASNGACIRNRHGLDSRACFDFLLAQKREGIIVGFSINYDVNMMLRDVPLSALRRLWSEGHCIWREYRLSWRPSKVFQITRIRGTEKQSVTVWDMFGFFGKSFVTSLKEWNICDEEMYIRIQAMKEQRGDFANVEDDAIESYCLSECRLLAELAAKVDSTFIAAGIRLARYDGAGAAASALLRKHRIKDHIAHFDEKTERLFLAAYFGGRNEVFQLGHCGRGYNYDINSAYPAATVRLPSLRSASFRHVRRYLPEAEHAIWRVEWELPERSEFGPFPLRLKDNSIIYARNGRGWYHAAEVHAAKEIFGDAIRVGEGYVLSSGPDAPFRFVLETYRERAKRKAAGDMAHLPLKLALNSLYGKMAQGYGWKPDKPPPYQQYFWAGEITARCRAQILTAVAGHTDTLFSIATDGIFIGQELPLPVSKALGEWERGEFDDYFSAQGGVYQNSTPLGYVQRNRGFATRDIDFDTLIREWERTGVGASVTYSATRFVGLGRALQGNFDDWRCWRKNTRTLSITTGNKWEGANHRLYLTSLPTGTASTPYKPKQSWLDFLDADSIAVERDQP